jgi:hypothetical protein
MTYQETRPWAKAMRAAVASRKMPPWFADPQTGRFLNDHSLKPSEIETIGKWAGTGAAEGDRKDMPAAAQWPDGWQIQPDLIVKGPVVQIPAHPKVILLRRPRLYLRFLSLRAPGAGGHGGSIIWSKGETQHAL